jgi:hypothetical protein
MHVATLKTLLNASLEKTEAQQLFPGARGDEGWNHLVDGVIANLQTKWGATTRLSPWLCAEEEGVIALRGWVAHPATALSAAGPAQQIDPRGGLSCADVGDAGAALGVAMEAETPEREMEGVVPQAEAKTEAVAAEEATDGPSSCGTQTKASEMEASPPHVPVPPLVKESAGATITSAAANDAGVSAGGIGGAGQGVVEPPAFVAATRGSEGGADRGTGDGVQSAPTSAYLRSGSPDAREGGQRSFDDLLSYPLGTFWSTAKLSNSKVLVRRISARTVPAQDGGSWAFIDAPILEDDISSMRMDSWGTNLVRLALCLEQINPISILLKVT